MTKHRRIHYMGDSRALYTGLGHTARNLTWDQGTQKSA